jgi:hypothetical protein
MQPRNFALADVPEVLLGEVLLDDGLPHAAARRAIALKATTALSVTLTGTSSAGAGSDGPEDRQIFARKRASCGRVVPDGPGIARRVILASPPGKHESAVQPRRC